MAELKSTKPLSGMVEITPAQQRVFDEYASRIRNVFAGAGFNHIEVPALERADVLLKDHSDPHEIYLFKRGDTEMGLRYDGTIGFARYVAGHRNDLDFPFRAYQIARNWRGERPQRGRYHEFWQCDLDIVGDENLSTNYDVEIVAVMLRAFETMASLIGKVSVRIGSRPFWNAIFEYAKLDEATSRTAFILVDKREKMSAADFANELNKALGGAAAEIILSVFSGGWESFDGKSESLARACEKIREFESILREIGVDESRAKIDLSIMRGHAYYTGFVFEFFADEYPELGAISGGGRYENLVSQFSREKIVGVGAAIGLSRLLIPILEQNKIDLSEFNLTRVAVIVAAQSAMPTAAKITAKLRAAGVQATAILETHKKLKRLMEMADKTGAEFVLIFGEDEIKNKTATLKNMKTGEQKSVAFDKIIEALHA